MEKNQQFSGEDTTNAKINENTFVMLLEDKRFATFVDGTPEVVNNNLTIALELGTKEEADTFFGKAVTSGAVDSTKSSPESEAFAYGKAFHDISGHAWELFTFTAKMLGA